MTAVLGSMDSNLFELRNFRANEFLYRERNSNKMKPARGSPPERSSSSPNSREGTSCDTQGVVSPSGRRSRYCTTQTAIVESPQVKRTISTSVVTAGETPTASRTLTAGSVESREAGNNNRALALRSPLGGQEETITTADFRSNDLGAVRARRESQTDPGPKYESKANVLPSLDEAALKKLLAKMVVREMQDVKKTEVPIRLNDFTGEKSPYLAEDAIVWLKKLRLAARQNEWNHALALEVASVHLKGLAARWFASIERHLNEELHLDRDRWNYFESQFEERFADFRSRLLQVEKIKNLKLDHGQDVREYAEAILSMNCRLEEPLDDEFLRWVFIQGLPPSELRDKLFKFEEKPHTLASAVKYARRFQLSQSVFNMKDPSTPISRMSPVSTPARSVRSN